MNQTGNLDVHRQLLDPYATIAAHSSFVLSSPKTFEFWGLQISQAFVIAVQRQPKVFVTCVA